MLMWTNLESLTCLSLTGLEDAKDDQDTLATKHNAWTQWTNHRWKLKKKQINPLHYQILGQNINL